MATLHIENTVHDFDTWIEVFGKFERFRADHGVRSYQLYRKSSDPNQVAVNLHFDTAEEARAFGEALQQIWQTPQSQEQLVDHTDPVLYEAFLDRDLSGAAASAS